MKPWTWRHAIINSDLPPTSRHVLLTLSCHVNDAGEPAYPSTALLAVETGLSERAVITHLRTAASAGWLIVQKHGYGGQKWARNQYYPRIPVGFEIPDRDDRGAEFGSVPSQKGRKAKALNEVQQPVDNSGAEGTEPRSVPSDKALNVVPEGTERGSVKALNHVQSNTAVNPAVNTAAAATREADENTAAAAAQKISSDEKTEDLLAAPGAEAEIVEWLLARSDCRIDPQADRVHVLTWVGKGVTVAMLGDAYDRALARRKNAGDDRPIYALFLSRFVDEIVAERGRAAAGPAFDPSSWFETPEGVDARGAEHGMRARKADEDWRYYRVLVAKATREPRAIEFVLRDAQRFNAIDLYNFARVTFGDALMPVDDYAS